MVAFTSSRRQFFLLENSYLGLCKLCMERNLLLKANDTVHFADEIALFFLHIYLIIDFILNGILEGLKWIFVHVLVIYMGSNIEYGYRE